MNQISRLFKLLIAILLIFTLSCCGKSYHFQQTPMLSPESPVAEPLPTAPIPATPTPLKTIILDEPSFIDRCQSHVYDNPDVGYSFDWSPDGSHILLKGWEKFYVFDISKSAQVDQTNALYVLPDQEYVYGANWSPDGSRVAYFNESDILYFYDWQEQTSSEFLNVNAESVRQKKEISDSVIWSPNGQQVAFIQNITRPWDSFGHWELLLVNVAERVSRSIPLPKYHVGLKADWSPDGRWIAVVAIVRGIRHDPDADYAIFLVDPNSSELIRITPEGSCVNWWRLAWSPDGRYLAFSMEMNEEWNLYIADVDTRDVRQLTSGATMDVEPDWSSDGQRLAFVRIGEQEYYHPRGGKHYQTNIYQINADGTGLRLILAMSETECCFSWPTWVPDQEAISFIFAKTDCAEWYRQQCSGHVDIVNSDGTGRVRLFDIPGGE